MKAVRIHAFGGAGVLQYEGAPLPEPGPTEVRVKILGWDAAGIVDASGPMALGKIILQVS